MRRATSPTTGPTMPCPFCGTLVRTVWNPHTDEVNTYHGEDILTTLRVEGAQSLTEAEVEEAGHLQAFGLITQLLALHGIAA